jgi:hypothetical protein
MRIYTAVVTFVIIILMMQFSTFSELKNQEFATVRGTVLDTLGRPINNAIVRLYSGERLAKETRADENASYMFTGLSAGRYVCKIGRSSGFKDAKSLDRQFDLLAGQNLVLDLVALNIPPDWPLLKSEIAGKVMQATGAALQDTRVRLINPFYHQVISQALTDKDGRYQFTIQMQGQYLIEVFYPGFLSGVKTIMTTGEKYTLDFALDAITRK